MSENLSSSTATVQGMIDEPRGLELCSLDSARRIVHYSNGGNYAVFHTEIPRMIPPLYLYEIYLQVVWT